MATLCKEKRTIGRPRHHFLFLHFLIKFMYPLIYLLHYRVDIWVNRLRFKLTVRLM